MVSVRRLVIALLLAATIPCPDADAYGIVVRSTRGPTRVDNTLQEFETGVLERVFDATRDLSIPGENRFRLVLNQDGQIQEAVFVDSTLSEKESNSAIEKIKALTFEHLPNLEEATLAMTFSFAELNMPPYRRNSLSIQGGGAVISGNINVGPSVVPGERSFTPLPPPAVQSSPDEIAIESAPGFHPYNQPGGNRGASSSSVNIDGSTDLVELSYLLEQAEQRRNYVEAVKIQRRLIAAHRPGDREALIRSNLKLTSLALSGGMLADAQAAYQTAIKDISAPNKEVIPELALDLSDVSWKLANKNLIDIADSGIRKAIDLDVSGNDPYNRASIDDCANGIVNKMRDKGFYTKALALQRFRVAKYKPTSFRSPGSFSKLQEGLASVLLSCALHDPANKTKLLSESNQVFKTALDGLNKTYGTQSEFYKRAISRRILELTAGRQTAAAQELTKLLK